MKLNAAGAALILMCLISACAPRSARLIEVPTPPARLEQEGYSFLPLNEKEWFIVGRNEQQIVLAKKGGSPDETSMIQAMLLQLPDFGSDQELTAWVKQGQAKDTDPGRFTVLNHDVSDAAFKGAHCVRSAMTAEDRQAVKRTESTGPMVLEVLAMTCPHPKDKNVGVYAMYSHRHYPGHQDPGLADKADELFQSIEFTAP